LAGSQLVADAADAPPTAVAAADAQVPEAAPQLGPVATAAAAKQPDSFEKILNGLFGGK
jgi:hypothetical protein